MHRGYSHQAEQLPHRHFNLFSTLLFSRRRFRAHAASCKTHCQLVVWRGNYNIFKMVPSGAASGVRSKCHGAGLSTKPRKTSTKPTGGRPYSNLIAERLSPKCACLCLPAADLNLYCKVAQVDTFMVVAVMKTRGEANRILPPHAGGQILTHKPSKNAEEPRSIMPSGLW